MGLGRLRRAVREGDVSQGTVLAGQVASMVKKEQPAREMIEEMFSQAEEVLNGATKWVKQHLFFPGQGAQYSGMGKDRLR